MLFIPIIVQRACDTCLQHRAWIIHSFNCYNLILLINRQYKERQLTNLTQHGYNSAGETGNEQSVWSHHPQLHTLNPGIIIFFLHIIFMHMWQNIHNIRLCLWHLFLTSLLPSFLLADRHHEFFISFATSIIQSSTLRQWTPLCMINFRLLQLLLPRCLFSSWCFTLSSNFLFCSFFSTSAPSLTFVSLSLHLPAAFSRLSLQGISALVRTLAPETVWEDLLNFWVTGAGLAR